MSECVSVCMCLCKCVCLRVYVCGYWELNADGLFKCLDHHLGCRRVLQGVLQCVCVAVCCDVLQCVAVCCSVLQCVAVCCGVLQCVAVCCSVLHELNAGGLVNCPRSSYRVSYRVVKTHRMP